MRFSSLPTLLGCLLGLFAIACVDPEDIILRGTVDVIVVDGTVTNLAEPQLIKLNRSRADPLTGRFGTLPVTKAQVEVIIDSSRVIACHETLDGTYQLPSDFKGEVGHAYQLRFKLSDGTLYASDHQIMQPVPPIDQLVVRFNVNSLPSGLFPHGFRAGYDCIIHTQDPANQRNFYRWDWKLWEKQKWCRSCYRGIYIDSVQQNYIQNGVLTYTRQAIEDCIAPASLPNGDFWNEYTCRTPCWDIFHNYLLTLFDDQLTNGAQVIGRLVAQVPLYTRQPSLLEIRQVALTANAFKFYQLLQQQTQNTGGLADVPPTAIVGNVINLKNTRESVVGYFTASAVTTGLYWLNKKDATTLSLGAYDDSGKIVESEDEVFYVQTTRIPHQGPDGPPFMAGSTSRYITAPCVVSDNRTPHKPVGWQD